MSGSFAAIWAQDGGPPFIARHNLNGDQFQQAFDEAVGQGFRPTRVSGYTVNGEELFAGIWEQDGGPPVIARHRINGDQYQQTFDEAVGQGFRPTCVSGYTFNGEERFCAIFQQDAGPPFVARHRITADQYQQTFDEVVPQGFRPTCVSGYTVNGEPRFAAIFQQDGGPAFIARHNITADQYQQAFDEAVGQGFRLTDVSGYFVNGEDRFTGIWQQDGGPSFIARHTLTGSEYQQSFDEFIGQGFRLRHVNAFDSRSFIMLSHFTFADDVSAENRARLIDRHRAAVRSVAGCGNLSTDEKDKLIETYRRAIHHTTLNEADVNARATVGGSSMSVNFGVLFPQGDEEISQTLIHEMMHSAGFTHPDRRDPDAALGQSCASPDPALFDCPNDNGQYFGTPPLRAEFCIAGDQSDVQSRLASKADNESCSIDAQGVATLHQR